MINSGLPRPKPPFEAAERSFLILGVSEDCSSITILAVYFLKWSRTKSSVLRSFLDISVLYQYLLIRYVGQFYGKRSFTYCQCQLSTLIKFAIFSVRSSIITKRPEPL